MAVLALKGVFIYLVLQFFAALAAWLDPFHFNVFVIAFLIFGDVLGDLVSCSKFSQTVLACKISFLIFLWYATTFGGFFRGFLDCDVEGA